jgi:hypothetical protein
MPAAQPQSSFVRNATHLVLRTGGDASPVLKNVARGRRCSRRSCERARGVI